MASKKKDYRIILYLLLFLLVSYLVFDWLLPIQTLPPFGVNVIVSILGSVITIALMMILMQYQMQSEERKEFKTMLFDKKLELYREFLGLVFKMDDDNMISRDEVQEVENKVGELALVAGHDLVNICAVFIVQLKSYGVLYTRSMVQKQKEHYEKNIGSLHGFISLDDLVQAIRNDLSVVEGDVSNVLEKFVNIQYDRFKMIKDPNNVD